MTSRSVGGRCQAGPVTTTPPAEREIAELFQWVRADEAVATFDVPERRARAGEEMADVLIYLVCLADVLGVDLGAAARAKLSASHQRFAADEVRGRAPEKP